MSTEYFILSNGVKMPVMGLGTWLVLLWTKTGSKTEVTNKFLVQSKPNEVSNAVEVALKTGYRLIDTAYAYGNEKEIGETLKKVFAEGKIKREDVFITTKVTAKHFWDPFNVTVKTFRCLFCSFMCNTCITRMSFPCSKVSWKLCSYLMWICT